MRRDEYLPIEPLIALSLSSGTGSSLLLKEVDRLEEEQKELSRIVIRKFSELEPRTEKCPFVYLKFSDVVSIADEIVRRPFEKIVKEESIVAVDDGLGTIEVSIKRLEEIRKRFSEEELGYKCCIYWLTLPYESLSEEFKKAEDALYKMRMFKDMLIVILDETREDIVNNLRKNLKITELPAMIITDKMIPLQEIEDVKKIEGWKCSSKAIKILVKREIFMDYMNKLYHLAKDNKLREKEKVLSIIELYGNEVYNELKSWISAIS